MYDSGKLTYLLYAWITYGQGCDRYNQFFFFLFLTKDRIQNLKNED